MPAYLSLICSSFLSFIAVLKFIVAAWRLQHERTRTTKLWLDMGVSATLTILSGMISFARGDKKGLQILLSLVGSLLVVFQVSLLSVYCTSGAAHWLWCGSVMYFIGSLSISILGALVSSHTKALQTALLSVVVAEYLVLITTCLVLMRLFGSDGIGAGIIHSNTGLCCFIWIGSLASLVLHLRDEVDFIASLWINTAAALVWLVWLVHVQALALAALVLPEKRGNQAKALTKKFLSSWKRGNQGGLELGSDGPQQDLERQNSTGRWWSLKLCRRQRGLTTTGRL